MSSGKTLLSLDLSADYPGRKDVLRNLRLDIRTGETVALIGQSGSGKSTLALAILRLLDWKRGTVRGRIEFNGRDLSRASEKELRSIRGREIALILQSAASALNPMLRIETQCKEAWQAHSCEPWATVGLAKVRKLFAEVDLPVSDEGFLRRYPREVSLGQAQRVLIAMALLHDPLLLLADEPTSALDVITQKEVLALLRRMAATRGMATLFISHDLLSVASLCDRVAILHAGAIVEQAPTAAIFTAPAHTYTRELIDALPANPFASGLGALHVALAEEAVVPVAES